MSIYTKNTFFAKSIDNSGLHPYNLYDVHVRPHARTREKNVEKPKESIMFIGVALFTISMLLYIAAMGWGLPRLFLRTKYRPVMLHARGLRRCLYNGKRCVVYERGMNWRRYITRYLLCQGEDCKLLKCQVVPAVRFMEYDVVLFNRYNRIFDVMSVREALNSPYTQLLRLPDETAYVSIQLRRVNKTTLLNDKPYAYLSRMGVIWFAVCAPTIAREQ